jgi:hypothetical protein
MSRGIRYIHDVSIRGVVDLMASTYLKVKFEIAHHEDV